MWDIGFFAILTLGVLIGLFVLRVREQRYLKKNTREAISSVLKEEIEQERTRRARQRKKFSTELDRFLQN